MSENSNTPAVRSPYTDELLRGLDHSDLPGILALASKTGYAPGGMVEKSADRLGNGFTVVPTTSKDRFVGIPFLILAWSEHESTKGGDENFVSMQIVCEQGKFILNDGGTGIRDQLRSVVAQRREETGGTVDDAILRTNLMTNGLRKSEYDYEDEKGKKSKATTFYLA